MSDASNRCRFRARPANEGRHTEGNFRRSRPASANSMGFAMRRKMTMLALSLLIPAGLLKAQAPPEALTLRRAVALAVENSRELKLALAQQETAERAAGLRRSVFLPNLYTGSDVAYSKGFPLGAPQVFNLSYQQTVFDAPKRGEVRAAEARAEIRRLEAERVRNDVIQRAAATFLELGHTRRALELLRKEREAAQKVEELTAERAREGLELPIEITRAQLTQARLRQRILQLEGLEDALEQELRGLTGIAPGTPLELAPDELTAAEERPVEEWVMDAVQRSVEVKQAELERRAREHRVRGELGGYLPTLELVGQYGIFSRANNYDEFYNKFERHNITVGLRARIPIFSSTRAASVRLARSELKEAEIEEQRQRAAVENRVRQQARRAREQAAAREVARLELKLAQENLQILQSQYAEGRASLRELEKARLEEHDRWRAFLEADLERQKAQLELLRSSGQLARLFP